MNTLNNLGICSIFGPDHDTQKEAICAELGEESTICQYFRCANASFPEGTGEVSVQQLFHLAQMGLLQ